MVGYLSDSLAYCSYMWCFRKHCMVLSVIAGLPRCKAYPQSSWYSLFTCNLQHSLDGSSVYVIACMCVMMIWWSLSVCSLRKRRPSGTACWNAVQTRRVTSTRAALAPLTAKPAPTWRADRRRSQTSASDRGVQRRNRPLRPSWYTTAWPACRAGPSQSWRPRRHDQLPSFHVCQKTKASVQSSLIGHCAE